MTALLEVTDIHVSFGGVVAVDSVSFAVGEAEVVGLIGPNGAGKTTLFEAIAGFTPCTGTVHLAGDDISGLAPHLRSRRGLVRSFQDAALFAGLTVRQCAMVAQQHAVPVRSWAAMLRTPGERRAEAERGRRADELLAAFGLESYADALIAELSTGTRRVCELVCALSLDPRVLLLDEPSAGLAQREVEQLPALLDRVRELTGATVLLVEHDLPLVLGLSNRILALESGRVIADGPPDQVRHDPEVQRSYLGGDPTAIHRSGAAVKPPPRKPTAARR
jgi:ABC-type branched-subunit amino acid transport system ATPase component